MGLDMYFNLKKREYTSVIRKNLIAFPPAIEQIIRGDGDLYKYAEISTSYSVGYLRKANAIHSWLVDNCHNEIDDCSEFVIPIKRLVELEDIIHEVICDKEKAETLLPTREGFLFGSLDYDEYYFKDLDYMYNLLVKVIDFLNGEDGKEYEFTYQASW